MAIGLTWLVLAGVVAGGALNLRRQLREQLLTRDAQVLSAMARVRPGETELDEVLDEDPFSALLTVPQSRGIIVMWSFKADGTFLTALPLSARDGEVPEDAMKALRQGNPRTYLEPSAALFEIFQDPSFLPTDQNPNPSTIPVLEVYVPVPAADGKRLGAIAGFLIEATSLMQQLNQLDRQLLRQGGLVLGVAMAITGISLGMLFRRLERAHGLVKRRTDDLLQANRELAQSARVAALGAVTAHLVHGLKNPISGLQSFVASRSPNSSGEDLEEWREAKAATFRMQRLIQDVVRVLREQETEVSYQVPLRELGESVFARARPAADRRRVRLVLEGEPRRDVDNRISDLLALILGNLVDNAIEATREGGNVTLHLLEEGETVVCTVVDEGAGIGAETRARLFQPQASTKEGGSGLGLVITRQLALALGGDVELVSTDAQGSTFRVELPREPARKTSDTPGGVPRQDVNPTLA